MENKYSRNYKEYDYKHRKEGYKDSNKGERDEYRREKDISDYSRKDHHNTTRYRSRSPRDDNQKYKSFKSSKSQYLEKIK